MRPGCHRDGAVWGIEGAMYCEETRGAGCLIGAVIAVSSGVVRSAAEAPHHVVEHGQAPAERVDADPLVDPVEPLEEPLVGIEAQW